MTSKLSVKRLSILTFALIACLSAIVGPKDSSAEETSTIRVEAGQTLEISTDTASSKSEFSWILTKDRKFQNAQRTRFFQIRLAEPGTYVLDVSVQDPITNKNDYRAFEIVITEPSGGIPAPTGDKNKPLSAVLQTDPPSVNGVTFVPSAGGIIKIDPSGSDGNIAEYHIDLDSSVDFDADGNPGNDNDTLGTLSEKSGTPLYVLMLPASTERKVKLSVTDLSDIGPRTAELQVLFAAAPAQSSAAVPILNPDSPVLIRREGATLHFSAELSETMTAGKELLYEWDFGDRSRSLLNTPSHTYRAPGTYIVGLHIRNITNAEVVYEGTETVVIDEMPAAESSSRSSASSVSESSASSSSMSSTVQTNVSFSGILQVSSIILLLLGLAIGLYMLFTWIKRKTATSLQQTLEKMEGTIVSKEIAVNEVKSVPMKLKKESPKPAEKSPGSEASIEREQGRQEFRAQQQRSNEPPITGSGPVPAWLAQSSTKAMPTPAPTPTPPAPPKATVTVQNIPAPAPAPAPVQDAPAPEWLKPAPDFSPVPAPAPKPIPVPASVPKPTPALSQTPIPQPPVPLAKPKTPDTPKPQPKPTPTPDPKIPEAPMPEPKPEVEPAPAPAPTPKPTPVSQPILPADPLPNADLMKKSDDEDPTIAIIQADSISK